jgi:predicted nucleic acid-binding protein
MKTILLDSGPLGMLAHRGGLPEIDACKAWLERLVTVGDRVIVPEIGDYEVRRELLRIGAKTSIERLNMLAERLEYLPITTAVMREAAELWARVRGQGRPTADRHALDGDVILASQARSINAPEVVIATTNVLHLAPLAPAIEWAAI